MKARRVILYVAILAIVGAQFWPVDRDNPAARGDPEAPVDVLAVLKRACYNCHSNETIWPWYGYVAPFSWILADHIEEGRAELNFSEWSAYPVKRQIKKREEIIEELEEGEMPPSYYSLMHGDASVSEEELAALKIWASGG